MRRSKKQLVVVAALEAIDAHGVEALTFEAVAERAGLTRGGVVYHFRTREDLLAGIAEELLARWTAELHEALEVPVERASRTQRLRALVDSVLDGVLLPGEFAFVASGRPEAERLNRAWDAFVEEWVGDLSTLAPAQRVGLLALDGWWSELGLGSRREMDAESRRMLVAMVCGQVPSAAYGPAASGTAPFGPVTSPSRAG